MPSKKNNAGTNSVIEMLSFAGACAILADHTGKIMGVTKKFADLAGGQKPNSDLKTVFDGLPEFPLHLTDGELKLRVKSSGREVIAKAVPAGTSDGLIAVIIKDDASIHRSQLAYASNDLIFQFDESGSVYYVSANVERITGYAADEFISGNIHPLDIIHPDDRPALEKEFRRLFVTHESTESSEHRIVKRNGEIAYLLKSWYSLLDADGTFTGIMGLNKDITQEKLLKERLLLFHGAFEHSTDAIVITGNDGKIIDVNDAFTRIYGYTREEAIGKATSMIQSRHSTREFYEQMWNSVGRDGQWRGEILNRTKSGNEIPIWLNITPIYLGDKKIGYMGIESDISDRKNLEQQIIQTEKLATIGQLAAGIAHEIGTPLNIISGNAEFVLLDMKESDPGHQELITIIEQTRRMSTLMRQLLDFARPKVLSLQPTDINGVLTPAGRRMGRVWSRRGSLSLPPGGDRP
ncbi:MAG TPA: PAS domain S-box protein, partial [Candidatus Kryptobacter bacterium]|nr:PAS domain S-box protein [Candidatus Kryptobacter bacterium]